MEKSLGISLRKILPVMQKRILHETTYFGVKTLKNPLDAWVYQELIFEIKPDVIIEIGNAAGGSALMLAHLCDLMGCGRVIGLDLSLAAVPDLVKNHPRITLIEGDACVNYDRVKSLVRSLDRVFIIEDSAHTYENTLNVLRTYSPLVTQGCYFIVEDSICHHGLEVGPHPGPYEAIETFTSENNDFIIDRSRESFFITWNPRGFLKKQ